MKQTYPSAERNKEPILEVLRRVLPARATVLEVASGTGQHAAFFASEMPGITWQPSEAEPELLPSIEAWTEGCPNVLPPRQLDVTDEPWPVASADAVVAINMVHISPWTTTEALFRGARRILPRGGLIVLYGPYRVGGAHTAPSNEAFHRDLQARNPEWGVRDVDDVRALGASLGFRLEETVQMPANNLTLVLRRG